MKLIFFVLVVILFGCGNAAEIKECECTDPEVVVWVDDGPLPTYEPCPDPNLNPPGQDTSPPAHECRHKHKCFKYKNPPKGRVVSEFPATA